MLMAKQKESEVRTCQGCGGILGRDCYNESDCLMISHREESYRQGLIQELLRRVEALEEKLGVREKKQQIEPIVFGQTEDLEIPF